MKCSLLTLICALFTFAVCVSAYDYCNNGDCGGVCRSQFGTLTAVGIHPSIQMKEVQGTCETVSGVKNFCHCFYEHFGRNYLNAP